MDPAFHMFFFFISKISLGIFPGVLYRCSKNLKKQTHGM